MLSCRIISIFWFRSRRKGRRGRRPLQTLSYRGLFLLSNAFPINAAVKAFGSAHITIISSETKRTTTRLPGISKPTPPGGRRIAFISRKEKNTGRNSVRRIKPNTLIILCPLAECQRLFGTKTEIIDFVKRKLWILYKFPSCNPGYPVLYSNHKGRRSQI